MFLHYTCKLNGLASRGVFWAAVVLLLAVTVNPGEAGAIERRKDQYPTTPSYLIFPLPYSLPGIGEGLFMPLSFSNMFGTTADMYLVGIFGDATGTIAALDELPLIEKTLLLDTFAQRITSATLTQYSKRGMNTRGDDFSYLVISGYDSLSSQLRLHFDDRRIELAARFQKSHSELDRILDNRGNLITAIRPRLEEESSNWYYTFLYDYTDDYQDPRRGVRFSLGYDDNPAKTSEDPDFFTVTTSLRAYLPLGKLSTLAFNYLRSDAHVRSKGLTDLATIKANDGIVCGVDPICLAEEDAQARNTRDARAHGTSMSLGGENYMRAYPGGRFQGAHTAYFGVELRLNFTEEFTPFNYWVWEDVQTGIQMAFFYEKGTVSELTENLWKDSREDWGVGFRLVAASGIVYRVDWATGSEGSNPVIIVFYPW